MSRRNYMKLPINADEGFPQAFRLNFAGNVYQVLLYVNVLEEGMETPDDHVYRLPVHERDPFLFSMALGFQDELEAGQLSEDFREWFRTYGSELSSDVVISPSAESGQWWLTDNGAGQRYIAKRSEAALNIHRYTEGFREAYMVMRVEREGSGDTEVIFQRKLVPNHEYEAAELAFIFRRMQVVKQNLNGVGAYGSEVVGGVAERWAS